MFNYKSINSARPWRAVWWWLSSSFLLAILGLFFGMQTVLPGPASLEVISSNPGEILAIHSGIPPKDKLIVILFSNSTDVFDPEFEEARDNLYLYLEQLKDIEGIKLFARIETLAHTNLDQDLFISKDEKHLLISAETVSDIYKSPQALQNLVAHLKKWGENFPKFQLLYLSSGTADHEIFELIHRDLDRSLIVTIPLTLIILLWAFKSILASIVPVFIALVSLVASLGAAALISHITGAISVTASQLVVFLVLAVGVDYSLFIISRMREEVSNGSSYPEAIEIASVHAGRAVLWSGFTVAISLSGLFLMRDTILTSMALVSIIAVFVTVVSTIFVLPKILMILGSKIEIGRLSKSNLVNKRYNRLLSYSLERPISTLLIGALIMIIPLSFCLVIRLGTTIEPDMLPASMPSIEAHTVLKEQFPELVGQDMAIILSAANLDEIDAFGKLEPFFDELGEKVSVRGPIQVDRSSDGTVKRYHYLVKGSGNDIESLQLIEDLRKRMIPNYLGVHGVNAYIAGTLPFVIDETSRYSSRTILVIGSVLLFSLLFLLCAFRSLVVPIKAVILNLLSTGVAFGALVILFQYNLIPFWNYGVIEGFIPPLLFAILFGLSMDYHVFLLSRISEEVQSGLSTKEGVARGIETTSRTITSAALIMVSVFLVIATLELPVMKQLGVGLAIAVFIDATIIRMFLLPASMVLLGKLNWYFPKWLNFLPNIKVH